ncbi:MAG: hypothetical protein K2X57_00680 [Xanthobacteraceae bacterium]|nr:hypothetical protein [Xanthobacteraceae bacterium]
MSGRLMGSYEKVINGTFSMHQIVMPRDGVAPLQVRPIVGGAELGEFALRDVLNGTFNISAKPPVDLADLDQTLSNDYDLSSKGSLAGPLGALSNAAAELDASGAKKVQLSMVKGVLATVDEGELYRAVSASTIRPNGPLAQSGKAFLLTAVASVERFQINLANRTGGSVAADAKLVDQLQGKIEGKLSLSSDGGLVIHHEKPKAFAARIWLLKRPWTGGDKVRILTVKGPMGLLGNSTDPAVDPEFAEGSGLPDMTVGL